MYHCLQYMSSKALLNIRVNTIASYTEYTTTLQVKIFGHDSYILKQFTRETAENL